MQPSPGIVHHLTIPYMKQTACAPWPTEQGCIYPTSVLGCRIFSDKTERYSKVPSATSDSKEHGMDGGEALFLCLSFSNGNGSPRSRDKHRICMYIYRDISLQPYGNSTRKTYVSFLFFFLFCESKFIHNHLSTQRDRGLCCGFPGSNQLMTHALGRAGFFWNVSH